jgi:hypothetical protein
MRTRGATIEADQLPNGYWYGKVSITIPGIPAPHVQESDSFHNFGEVLVWARGVVELLVMHGV